jgi:leucyl aminopeptidase (aminopeptidase T)
MMLRETLFSELAKWSLEFKGVNAGDEVLICVSPDTHTTRFSALVTHCKAIEAIPHVLVVNTPKEAVGLWSLGRAVKLPRTVAEALKATDYIYWFANWDPAFLQEIRDAREAGAQFLFGWQSAVKEAIWHIRDIDRKAMAKKAQRWAKMLNKHKGKRFRLITGGEELTGTTRRFEGWGPGTGKASWTQNETMSVGDFHDANGVQIVDWIGTFSEVTPGEKARFTIEDGVLTKAEGEIGKMFWNALETVDDPNIYRLAELAVGMNPYTRKGLTPLGASNLPMTIPPFHEIKQAEGTVHTAFGDSGGRILQEGETGIVSKLHIDVISLTPTLYIDGKKYIEDGKLLF